MYSLISLICFAATAEVIRRCVMILLNALTGPLSKIPGPFIYKFTRWPWVYQNITGNQMNVAPELFERYGDVVRVSKLIF